MHTHVGAEVATARAKGAAVPAKQAARSDALRGSLLGISCKSPRDPVIGSRVPVIFGGEPFQGYEGLERSGPRESQR